MHHQPNRDEDGRRKPLRTFEQLEALETQSRASETDAIEAVAVLLRELAIRLPEDSTLIRAFAQTANELERHTGRSNRFAGEIAGTATLSLLCFTDRLIQRYETGDIHAEAA